MADLAHQMRRRRGPLVDRARAELAAGRPWMARAQLNSLIHRNPGHAEGRALLVETLIAMGDPEGAERVRTGASRTRLTRRMREELARAEADAQAGPLRRSVRRLGRRTVGALQTAVAAVVLLGVGALVATPFALFGIGLYQVGSWISLW